MKSKAATNTNVAIAAAVTAYGRMIIHSYKIIPGNEVYYSDDSVFLSKPLDSGYISSALRAMKDELSGGSITKAIFLGAKQYVFEASNSTVQHRSVFAGIERDSLSYDQYVELLQKGSIQVQGRPEIVKQANGHNILSNKATLMTLTSNTPKVNDATNRYLTPKVTIY